MTEPAIKTVGEGSFEDVVRGASPVVRETAAAARLLMASVMPGVTEVPWVRQKTVGYGVGPKKMSEHFCYLGIHKGHVNLGFFYGADLNDPEGLLQGSGKKLRHIKLRAPEEVDSESLRALVHAASQHLPKLRG